MVKNKSDLTTSKKKPALTSRMNTRSRTINSPAPSLGETEATSAVNEFKIAMTAMSNKFKELSTTPTRSKSLKLPDVRFSGRQDENANDFLVKLNIHRRWQQYEPDELLNIIPAVLTGRALTWWLGIDSAMDITSWRMFEGLFRDKFLSGRQQDMLRAQIYQRKLMWSG